MQQTFSRSGLLLTPDEMAGVDRAAAASGIDSFLLMRMAGEAVAAAALKAEPGALRFIVLTGPGNNGGDGYVAAEALKASGADVVLFAMQPPAALTGDAARAAAGWTGAIASLDACDLKPGDVVVDALFGAGLSRPVPDTVVALAERAQALSLPVISIDLPSGIDGRTGTVRGGAFRARHTITFMSLKPGHVLMPGRDHCGRVEVVDIGIPERFLTAAAGRLAINAPAIFDAARKRNGADSHKFSRGHLVVFSGGPSTTGAARLSATAGLKAGAGLVTLASPGNALAVNTTHLTAVMTRRLDDLAGLTDWLEDRRLAAFVLGPGFGVSETTRLYALALVGRPVVFDADAITAFAGEPGSLFEAIRQNGWPVVLTPHAGEFARLFPDLSAKDALSKIDKARAAAARSGAVVLFKGADTVVAAPDGRAVVNVSAPPFLATAGSGDVLAGIIGAHLAEGMPPFEAAAAGAWRHGAAGYLAGEGMTAEDLVAAIRPLP
ncbi:yjeF C-terminal region, hydroxyethylthiazole kinase-related/yjeF N-terminal region [Rhizobium sp. RU20A]|uniref:NAD(P)H-hydrate dehydratase n=1 Tax=Rhizobium sp. RU20A TaxID=1907412 RepID=UPI000953E6C4|nr:NAD(P)H-hydrate dehydratase [Rhizobium sp. RU20A]SIQ04036.1 yjeF C-terminal region, hydroxyethylthiazole kinase-related/yjeF N-terminal region [Rhizobium sp. RU20A]